MKPATVSWLRRELQIDELSEAEVDVRQVSGRAVAIRAT